MYGHTDECPSLALLAQTLLVFVPRHAPGEWFVVDSSSALYPRLSLSAEKWIEQVSCVQPQHYLTATQSLDPRNQYHLLQHQTWEQYYSAVDSSSAVTDSTFR